MDLNDLKVGCYVVYLGELYHVYSIEKVVAGVMCCYPSRHGFGSTAITLADLSGPRAQLATPEMLSTYKVLYGPYRIFPEGF